MSLCSLGRFLICGALCGATATRVTAQSDPWSTGERKFSATQPSTSTRVKLVRGMAIRSDITLRDGTIETDIDPPQASRFAGLAFRVKDAANYDVLYFYSDSLRWTEVQYQAFHQGSPTWQLYPGAGYLGKLPAERVITGRPMHVKIVFVGKRADVYVNSDATPVLSVPELKGIAKEGHVAVWTTAPAQAPLVFDHFSATGKHTGVVALPSSRPRTDGLIFRSWNVSERLPSPDSVVAPAVLTPELKRVLRSAKRAVAEQDGLVSLTRIVGNPGGAQPENVPGGAGWGLALARTSVTSPKASVTKLHVGYSDGISIFLNDKLVYSGTHPYSGADLGRIIGEPNEIALNLHAGKNELVFAVTDRAFGWGFRAHVDGGQGITVER